MFFLWQRVSEVLKNVNTSDIFTALHWMQGGLATRKLSLRLSVRPSVCQTRGLWQNGRKICAEFHTIQRSLSL